VDCGKLIQWHREKAGTIELVHDVLKNELAAGVLPCGRFRECGVAAARRNDPQCFDRGQMVGFARRVSVRETQTITEEEEIVRLAKKRGICARR